MYSLSTCWNSHRHRDGRALLREIRDLGFSHAELSHGTRISLLPGILEAVDAGEIQISSLHNFCPLPIGVNYSAPNLYVFSDPRPRDRELAEKHTRKTLNLATRVKAPAIVLHLGCIEMQHYTRRLETLLHRGYRGHPGYVRRCLRVHRRREALKAPYVQRVNDLLKKLLPEAEVRGLKLGFENREALEELPLDSDFPALLKEFSSPAIGYWHDTGHAQIKENLGFLHHRYHLETLCDRLVGFHIHDVKFPGQDHCAPGTGTVDFAALKPLVKPEHIKVFELSPSLSAEEITAGVAHVKAIWGPE
jgi:sugar phosphate isomerase/epimerase